MYLAMGMTYSQFWDERPQLAVAYRKAYRLKREMDNENAWLHGMYVYDAFAVVMANAFSKRGAKKYDYIEKPFDLFPLSDEKKKKRVQEEYAKMQKALEDMARKQRRKKKQKGD